jgi:hypothetical protein
MVQDPRTLDDTVNYSLFVEKFSHVVGNPKRYATYFTSKASIIQAEQQQQHDAIVDDDDDDSTLEFSTPISHSSRSSRSTNCTSTCTPAQEVIIRYRSGISLETRSTSPSLYSESDSSWEMTSPTELSHLEHATPDQDIKIRYRQSRYDALLNTVCQTLSLVFQVKY